MPPQKYILPDTIKRLGFRARVTEGEKDAERKIEGKTIETSAKLKPTYCNQC
jgi:hypothetical protein